MRINRSAPDAKIAEYKDDFKDSIDFVHDTIGTRAFRLERALNAAVFDAVLVGLARRLADRRIVNLELFKQAYSDLLQESEFRDATTARTANERNVEARLRIATDTFARVD